METKNYDVVNGIKNSFFSLKNKDVLIAAAIGSVGICVFEAAYMLAYLGILGGMAEGRTASIVGVFAVFLLQMSAMLLIYVFIIPVCQYFNAKQALRTCGIKPSDNVSFFGWFALNVKLALITLSCWYEKKWLLVFPAGWAMHGIRTKFSRYMYLEGKEGDLPKISYDFTGGKTFDILIPDVIVSACGYMLMMAVYMVLFIPLVFVFFAMGLYGASSGSTDGIFWNMVIMMIVFLPVMVLLLTIQNAFDETGYAGIYAHYRGQMEKKVALKEKKK